MRSASVRVAGIIGLSMMLIFSVIGCGLGRNSTSNVKAPIQTSQPTLPALPSASAKPPASKPDPEPSAYTPLEIEIDRMLSDMTLPQKIGQMLLVGIDGTEIDSDMRSLISEQHVGGIILYKDNFSGLSGTVQLINALKKANQINPAPLFISVDQEGGKVSRLPSEFVTIPNAATVGKTGKPELAEEMGSLLSKELQVMGFNVDFAPVLDINSNPNNPVIGTRSFGNNAERVTEMGIAAMKGLREGGTIAVVKHFPGHGDTSVDSHLELPTVNKTTAQLEKMEWVPFRTAIDNQADAVMVAHILFPLIDPDAPASFSKVIIGEQLRGTLGYDGVVITDDMTMGAIKDNYGIAEASVKSVQAGSDIVLIAHGYSTEKKVYDKLLQAVESGQITPERIDESVRRILKLKLGYSLTDEPIAVPTKADLPNDAIRSWLTKIK